MDKLKRNIINKYDFFLYHLVFNSLKRLSLTDIGFVYLLELWLRNWRLEKGISTDVKRATESFFDSLLTVESDF